MPKHVKPGLKSHSNNIHPVAATNGHSEGRNGYAIMVGKKELPYKFSIALKSANEQKKLAMSDPQFSQKWTALEERKQEELNRIREKIEPKYYERINAFMEADYDPGDWPKKPEVILKDDHAVIEVGWPSEPKIYAEHINTDMEHPWEIVSSKSQAIPR